MRRLTARPGLHLPTIAAFGREWFVIVSTMAAAIHWSSVCAFAAAALIIATRQHALLVLYHDGVHGLVARSHRLNDFVVNLAVGVPLLLPIHLYRALHLSHHRHLGAPCDPERVLLYRGQPWSFRPLATGALARQLAGDASAWNALVLALRYFRETRAGTALKLPRPRAFPELVLQYASFCAVIAATLSIWPMLTLQVALLWFLPYLTLTQLLQKLRSFAEHVTADVEPSLTCSWRAAIIGRLTIWPYNINYHREHHARPRISWDRLPAAFPGIEQWPGRRLLAHVWSGTGR